MSETRDHPTIAGAESHGTPGPRFRITEVKRGSGRAYVSQYKPYSGIRRRELSMPVRKLTSVNSFARGLTHFDIEGRLDRRIYDPRVSTLDALHDDYLTIAHDGA